MLDAGFVEEKFVRNIMTDLQVFAQYALTLVVKFAKKGLL